MRGSNRGVLGAQQVQELFKIAAASRRSKRGGRGAAQTYAIVFQCHEGAAGVITSGCLGWLAGT